MAKEWTEKETQKLEALCMDELPNSEIAKRLGRPLSEIHAKRSCMGLTIAKVAAMKAARPKVVPKKTPVQKKDSAPKEAAVSRTCLNCSNPCCIMQGHSEHTVPGCTGHMTEKERIRVAVNSCTKSYLESIQYWASDKYGAVEAALDKILGGTK